MNVLIDTSIWIAYFRGEGGVARLDRLLDEGLAATNDLILAELIPHLEMRKQSKLIELLRVLRRIPLPIDWDDIVRMQLTCLLNGINGIGIPDLIIAQNAVKHQIVFYTLDRHFQLIARHMHLVLF